MNSLLANNLFYITAGIFLGAALWLPCFFYRKKFFRSRPAPESGADPMINNIVNALAKIIDAKDHYTSGHSLRVAEYARQIASLMNKSPKEQRDIYFAGLLHDIGKVRIPEGVINKPGRLSEDEFEEVKIHTISGYHILKDIFGDSPVTQGAKFHHEKYDGSGYPTGLKGANIPEAARIICVADSYDAMTSNRGYRSYMPQEKVKKELQDGKGRQFDPYIADIMLKIIDADKEYALRQTQEMNKTIMIVDDEPINIKMINFVMRDESLYTMLSAASGREALDLLATNKVDLLLLDVKMPEMDGFETLKRAREISSAPVVFMTASKDLPTIRRASSMGIDDYLTKPFMPGALKEVIHSLLR